MVRLNGVKGFTLVETVVAVLILGIVCLPVTAMLTESTRLASGAWHTVTAVAAGQSVLEELKDAPFGEVKNQGREALPGGRGLEYSVEVQPGCGVLETVTVCIYYRDSYEEKQVRLTMEKLKR